jgi:hypothetical protein
LLRIDNYSQDTNCSFGPSTDENPHIPLRRSDAHNSFSLSKSSVRISSYPNYVIAAVD